MHAIAPILYESRSVTSRILRRKVAKNLPTDDTDGAALSPSYCAAGIVPSCPLSMYKFKLTVCRFKPANVLIEGLASSKAKQYSLFVRN
jgi:hypothetical protein